MYLPHNLIEFALEPYRHEHKHPMNIDSMTADDLRAFADFLSSDYDISMNTIVTNMTMLRTVCNWVRKQGVTNNDPFFGYDMPKALYGTPYFLTIQERDQVLGADLTDDAELAEYRDMFVFQCMVGCRHSDLVTTSTPFSWQAFSTTLIPP